MSGLDNAYGLKTPEQAQSYYDAWAAGYDTDLTDAGYVTPKRCAEALAAHAVQHEAPLADFGCGTGLSGVALRAAGFACIDGFDIAPRMLEEARGKGIYRALAELDLSQTLGSIAEDTYKNIAAIGVLNPAFMPETVIDEMLGKLPSGGCLVLSINDKAAKDGGFERRIFEQTECGAADLLVKDYGEHIPDIDLLSTVYLLRKR